MLGLCFMLPAIVAATARPDGASGSAVAGGMGMEIDEAGTPRISPITNPHDRCV